MHIDNLGEFEELVHDIKCPLLIFLVNRWNRIDLKQFDIYKKYINIIDINIDNAPSVLTKHRLRNTPCMVLYNDGIYQLGAHYITNCAVRAWAYNYGVGNE